MERTGVTGMDAQRSVAPAFGTLGRWTVLVAVCAGMSLGRAADPPADQKPTVVIVVGAPGEDEFGRKFIEAGQKLEVTAQKAGAKVIKIGTDAGQTNDLQVLREKLRAEPHETPAELWLVLFGHGTYDSRDARFNLRGLDLTAAELAELLKPFRRPLAIIDASSASGPFLKPLSAPGRVVVTATRSGAEHNYARFGNYFAEALAGTEADLDKDGQTSLLEAFLGAAAAVGEFYTSEGRLATEHALIDDNGDGLGTPPDWFRGVRAVKRSKDGAAVDGLRAHQFHLLRNEQEQKLSVELRARRDQMEIEIEKLRESRARSAETVYLSRLEALLLEISRIYERAGTNWSAHVTAPGADGVIVLTARDAVPHGSTIRLEPGSGERVMGFWTRRDDWLSWDLRVDRPGRYQVEVIQAAAPGDDGSEFQVGIGNQTLRSVVPETGAGTNFVAKIVGTFEMPQAGPQSLSVRALTMTGQSVMELRRVVLKPVSP